MKEKYTEIKINNTTFDKLVQNETQRKLTKHNFLDFACDLVPPCGE